MIAGDHTFVVGGDIYVQYRHTDAEDTDRGVVGGITRELQTVAEPQSPTGISASPPPEMIIQSGSGAQVDGRQAFTFNFFAGNRKIEISPLNHIQRRKENIAQAVKSLAPADIILHFVSNLWGFTIDLPLPSTITVDALIRILLEGLDLPRNIDIPNVSSDVEVRWSLEDESATVLDPSRSLAGTGLKSGDTIHLRAKILPVPLTFG